MSFDLTVDTLLHRACKEIAKSCDISHILSQLPYIAFNARILILLQLSDVRLLQLDSQILDLDVRTECEDNAIAIYSYAKEELNAVWGFHCKRNGCLPLRDLLHHFGIDEAISCKEAIARVQRAQDHIKLATGNHCVASYKILYWDSQFRHRISKDSGRVADQDGSADTMIYYKDVVQQVKLKGRDIDSFSINCIMSLTSLKRLEVHSPPSRSDDPGGGRHKWDMLLSIIKHHPTLREIGFFHGQMGAMQIKDISNHLCCRLVHQDSLAPISNLEFVSISMNNVLVADTDRPVHSPEILVDLLRQYTALENLRILGSISGSQAALSELITIIFGSPKLKSLSLQHVYLEDAAFRKVGQNPFAHFREPNFCAIHTLAIAGNLITASTIEKLCQIVLSRSLHLEKLDLQNNTEIGDSGATILISILCNSSTLHYINLSNCEIGISGASLLMKALAGSSSIKYLDLSSNPLTSAFASPLAYFLRNNATLEILHCTYISLYEDGCTTDLLDALAKNQTLREIDFANNRLRDTGSSSLFRALCSRSATKPYSLVGLSGNLITHVGLSQILAILNDKFGTRAGKKTRYAEGTCLHKSSILQLDLRANLMSSTLESRRGLKELHRYIDILLYDASQETCHRSYVYDDEV